MPKQNRLFTTEIGTLLFCPALVVVALATTAIRYVTSGSPGEDALQLVASAGMYTHLDGAHARVPVGKFKIGLIASERKPHLTNNVLGDPRVGDQRWAQREGMIAFAGYPLMVGRNSWGWWPCSPATN